MKRSFLCVLSFLLAGSLLLSGCGKGKVSLDGLTDPRGSIPFDQRSHRAGFLETSFADYYTLYPEGSNLAFIQVQPKESELFVPLCSKPNCKHDDRSCNAVCTPGGGLGYCNDRLFTVDEDLENAGYVVVSMLPDGTDRKTEAGIPNPIHSDGTQDASYQFVFHEDWLFVLYIPSANLPLEEQVERLFAIDLTDNSITEPFSDFFTADITIGAGIRPVGKTIYTDAYFRDSAGATEGWLISMDLDDGAVKKLIPMDYPWGFNIEGDVLYYQPPGGSFTEYDLRTGETASRGQPVQDSVGDMRLDGERIYTYTNSGGSGGPEDWDFTLYIYDRAYQLVDQIHLGAGVYPQYVDETSIYFSDQLNSTRLAYRLDKAAVGTGDLKLIPLGS